MHSTNRLIALCSLFIVLTSAGVSLRANAAPPPVNIAAMNDDNYASSKGFWGFTDGINRSSALLGDMWGLRTDLSKY